MACKGLFSKLGHSTTNINADEVSTDVYTYGIGCINANLASCSANCNDLTKSLTACYSCLAQSSTCPPVNCRGQPTGDCVTDPTGACCPQATQGCCPYAQEAFECGTCVSKKGGQTADDFAACLKDTGMSRTTLIIIIVCTVVGVIIVIAAITIAIKVKRNEQARNRLERELPTTTDPNVIARLNAANIQSSELQSVADKLAIASRQARAPSAQAPTRVSAPSAQTQSTDDEEFI